MTLTPQELSGYFAFVSEADAADERLQPAVDMPDEQVHIMCHNGWTWLISQANQLGFVQPLKESETTDNPSVAPKPVSSEERISDRTWDKESYLHGYAAGFSMGYSDKSSLLIDAAIDQAISGRSSAHGVSERANAKTRLRLQQIAGITEEQKYSPQDQAVLLKGFNCGYAESFHPAGEDVVAAYKRSVNGYRLSQSSLERQKAERVEQAVFHQANLLGLTPGIAMKVIRRMDMAF